MHTLLISLALLSPAPVPGAVLLGPSAEETQAQQLRDQVGPVMAEGDFDRAEQLVREAHELHPRDDFYYALANIAGARGDCKDEIRYYERYFEEIGYEGGDYVAERYAKPVKRATDRLEECRAQVPDPVVTDPPADPTETEIETETDPAEDPEGAEPTYDDEHPPKRRWITDPWGGVLVAGGVAAVGGGATAMILGQGRYTDATMAGSEQNFVDEARAGRRTHGIGIGLTVLGSAAIIGGVIRYALVARRNRRLDQARIQVRSGRLTLRW